MTNNGKNHEQDIDPQHAESDDEKTGSPTAGQPFNINENTVDDPSDNEVLSPELHEGRGDPSGSPFDINENSIDDTDG